MPTPSTHKKSKPLSPFIHLLIPVAFVLGLGSGYLLWGYTTTPAAADTTGVQRVNVSTDGEPSIGPDDAPVTIIEFSDYQCGYCKQWHDQVFQALMASYPNQIRFVYRDFPIFGDSSVAAAEAAACAGAQGAYWEFHDAIFSGQYELGRAAYEQYAADLGLDTAAFSACMENHTYREDVMTDYYAGVNVGVQSTPTFFINGRIVIGALPFENFKALIDEELGVNP